VDRRVVFVDDADRQAFLDALERVCSEASAELLAYCLMGNHFHLVIKVADIPLADIMRRVLAGYARGFNLRYERTGHLFQARYDAKICLTESYLATVIPYILLNPVRAGLVSKPEDWPWSSLRGKPLIGDFERQLSDFNPWENDSDLSGILHRGEPPPCRTLDEIGASVSSQTAISIAEMRADDRRRAVVAAKRMFAQISWGDGHKGIAIAQWLNAANSSVSRYLQENTGNWKN